MGFFKPPFGAPLLRGHPLAPRYGAWLLNSQGGREYNSVDPTSSGPVQTGVVRRIAPWGPVIECPSAAGVYSLTNLRIPSGSEDNNECIVARIYPRNVSTGFHAIYANSTTGFFVSSGKLQLYNQTASTGSLTANVWQTVAVQIVEGVKTEYYINGKLDSTIASGSVGIPTNQLNPVGIGNDGANEYLDGFMDYVLIFTRTLTPAEHMALHLDPFQMFADVQDTEATSFLPVPTDVIYLDQLLWEVAVDLDTPDPNPAPITDPAGGGTFPASVNPDDGTSICGAEESVVWWEIDRTDGMRRYAKEAINLDATPKEGRLIVAGTITRALSNQFSEARGSDVSITVADDDRVLRTMEMSESLIGTRASAYVSSRAAIQAYRDTSNAVYKPRRVFDGIITDCEPSPGLEFGLSIQDYLTYLLNQYNKVVFPRRVFTLDDFPNMANPVDSDSPGNPEMIGKPVPVGYGLLSDEQDPVPQGVVPFVYTGMRPFTSQDGMLWHEFVAFGHPAGWRGSIFVPSGGGLSTGTSYPSRMRITPATYMADWAFPGNVWWTAEFGATNYRVINGRAYECVYGLGSTAYLAATGKVPLCANYGGFTDASNGSGNVVTSLRRQIMSLLANWVFGNWELGAPLVLPTVGTGGDLYDRLDTTSFEALPDIAGAFILGANGDTSWTLDKILTQAAINLHAEYGVNKDGQIFMSALDLTPVINRLVTGLSDVEQRTFKTKRHRELVRNIVKWRCGRRYVAPFTQGTPEEGALMPVNNTMPSTEWVTDNQQIPAGIPPTSASITKYGEQVADLSFEMIRDPTVAEPIAQSVVDENEVAPIYSSFTEGPCGMDTDLNDVDTVDHYDALTESGRDLRCEKHTLELDTLKVTKDNRDVT